MPPLHERRGKPHAGQPGRGGAEHGWRGLRAGDALRTAYAAALKEPELLAEAQKLNMQLRPQTGAQVSVLSKRVTDTPKRVLERTAKILGW